MAFCQAADLGILIHRMAFWFLYVISVHRHLGNIRMTILSFSPEYGPIIGELHLCHVTWDLNMESNSKMPMLRPRNLRLSEFFNHVQSIHHMFTLGTISLYAGPETHE